MLFGECFRQNASLLDCGGAFFDGLRTRLWRVPRSPLWNSHPFWFACARPVDVGRGSMRILHSPQRGNGSTTRSLHSDGAVFLTHQRYWSDDTCVVTVMLTRLFPRWRDLRESGDTLFVIPQRVVGGAWFGAAFLLFSIAGSNGWDTSGSVFFSTSFSMTCG